MLNTPQQAMTQSNIDYAIHEAGHVICGMALKWTLKCVYIRKVNLKVPDATVWKLVGSSLTDASGIASAGSCAEHLYKRSKPIWPDRNQPIDNGICTKAFQMSGGLLIDQSSLQQWKASSIALSEKQLVGNWNLVLELANTLEKKPGKVFCGQRILSILSSMPVFFP